jgi:hypothetical protein
MSEAPELEGAFVSAGAMDAIHLREIRRVKNKFRNQMALTRWPGNHAAIADLVRDGSAGTGFEGALRLQPRLGHGTLDNVPLNPFAFRTGKRSQILASATRFNGRELHWRTAHRAWRTLVLSVEHGLVPSSAP